MGEVNSKKQPNGIGILRGSVGDELFGEFINGKLTGHFIHRKHHKCNYWIYKAEGSNVGTFTYCTRDAYDWLQRTSRIKVSEVWKAFHLFYTQQCDAYRFYNDIPVLGEGYEDAMHMITFSSGTSFEKKIFISPEEEPKYQTHKESTDIAGELISKLITDDCTLSEKLKDGVEFLTLKNNLEKCENLSSAVLTTTQKA